MSKFFHLLMVSILQSDEALSNLKEVAVWLIWGKVSVEHKALICADLLLRWKNFEWVFDELASRFVKDG